MPSTGMRRLAAFLAFMMVLTASWNAIGAGADPFAGAGRIEADR